MVMLFMLLTSNAGIPGMDPESLKVSINGADILFSQPFAQYQHAGFGLKSMTLLAPMSDGTILWN